MESYKFQSLLILSYLEFKKLAQKRIIFFCMTLLIICGFLLIPREDANYITYYCGKTAIVNNKYWIGNIAGVFSNIIIYILLHLVVAGNREKDIISGLVYYEKSASFSKAFINFYKILSIFFLSIFFLIILNVSLIATNYRQVSVLIYIVPILYFSVPFLFFTSFIVFFIEYLIGNRILKYIIYYSILLLIIAFDENLFQIIGNSELAQYYNDLNISSDNYAIGVISKQNIQNLVTIDHFILPKNISYKLIFIFFTFLSIYIFSFFPTNMNISLNNQKVELIGKKSIRVKEIVLDKPINYVYSFFHLIYKDFYLLFKSFSSNEKFAIIIIWIIILLGKQIFTTQLISLIFIISLNPMSIFIAKQYIFNTETYEKTAPFSEVNIHFSKIIIVVLFNYFLLFPLILQFHNNEFMPILINFTIVSIIQYISINLIKDTFLTNIILLIIYGSYFTNAPLLNLFCL